MNKVPYASMLPRSSLLYTGYLTIGIAFFLLYCVREILPHGVEPAAFKVIHDLIEKNHWLTNTVSIALSLASIAIGLAALHEACHYLAIPSCHINGKFHFNWKSFTPSVSCSARLSKRRYIVVALSPFIIITPPAFIVYFLSHDIFVRTVALSIALLNVVGSSKDIFAAIFVYRSKYVSFLEGDTYLTEYSTLND